VLIWNDTGDADLADVCTAAQAGQYDTSSGDSCWVRQYLEWCQPMSAILARNAKGCELA